MLPGRRHLRALVALTMIAIAVIAGGVLLATSNQEVSTALIAFASTRDGQGEIYTLDPVTRNETRITSSSTRDADPAWSPDGTLIAFSSERDGGDPDIYLQAPEPGAGTVRIARNTAKDQDPSWSPNGAQIAFASTRSGLTNDIYVISSQPSLSPTPRRLTSHSQHDVQPAWSPDGREIAFASKRDGNWEIYVMPQEGCAAADFEAGACPERLTSDSKGDEHPSWSPDGSHIAFTSKRDGDWEIHVMRRDGTGVRQVTQNTVDDRHPAWSPDGSELAYHSKIDRSWYIVVTRADGGGGPRQLSTSRSTDATPSWKPDRRGLAAGPDFNGDGFSDLAVGVPGEALGSVQGAGMVNVLYGSGRGLASGDNQAWHQNSRGIEGAAESGDAFGSSIASGDFTATGSQTLPLACRVRPSAVCEAPGWSASCMARRAVLPPTATRRGIRAARASKAPPSRATPSALRSPAATSTATGSQTLPLAYRARPSAVRGAPGWSASCTAQRAVLPTAATRRGTRTAGASRAPPRPQTPSGRPSPSATSTRTGSRTWRRVCRGRASAALEAPAW